MKEIKETNFESEIDAENLSVKGEIETEDGELIPFELLLGLGRCNIAKEYRAVFSEEDLKEEMHKGMRKFETPQKDIYFDWI